MALTLYGGFLIVLVNAVADLAYSRLDPRIRLE
jgi:ABC-type dipeptide/oligopeptide/nickel transport system permease component